MRKPDIRKYEDLLDHPRHESKAHPKMPQIDRAAQFSPFAALSGFDAMILEEGRETLSRTELTPADAERLNDFFARLEAGETVSRTVRVTYFEDDALKDGGMYKIKIGELKRVDPAKRVLIFRDKTVISFEDLINIEESLNIEEPGF